MFLWIFSSLSVIDRNISAFNKRFSPVLTELVSTCRKKNIEAKYFFKKRVSYIFFRTSIELFSAFCRNFSDEVVKAAFYVSIATFWKNNAEKFQMLGRKPSAFCDKFFDRVVKVAFQVYMGTNWAGKLSNENLTFSCSDIERNVFTFVRKFFNWVVRTAFYLAKGLFWEEVSPLSFSPIFFGHWAKNLREFVDCLSTGLSKLHSSCPEAFFALNIFCKKVVELFITFGLSDKKRLLSDRKTSPYLSKVHSDCPLEKFDERFSSEIFFGHF